MEAMKDAAAHQLGGQGGPGQHYWSFLNSRQVPISCQVESKIFVTKDIPDFRGQSQGHCHTLDAYSSCSPVKGLIKEQKSRQLDILQGIQQLWEQLLLNLKAYFTSLTSKRIFISQEWEDSGKPACYLPSYNLCSCHLKGSSCSCHFYLYFDYSSAFV